MRRVLVAVLLFAVPAVVGCSPKLLPHTEIRDTPDARQIIDIVTAYRNALEGRNVDGVMKLISSTFFETCGTPEGSDDFNTDGLKQKLTNWVQKVVTVRLDLEIKNIVFAGDIAHVPYFFDLNYQFKNPDGSLIWKRETDSKELILRREGTVWRITGGV